MAELIKGKPLADQLLENGKRSSALLLEQGVAPALAIIRMGDSSDDLAYENSIERRCQSLRVSVEKYALARDVSEDALLRLIKTLNGDACIHGILLMRPLPENMDDNRLRNAIAPEKDVDGITDASLAGVFTDSGVGFAPCTAEACLLLLKSALPTLSGKNAVVVGRSLVVGRPLAMLLLKENATVTICHTRTKNLPEIARQADILVAAAGRAQMVDEPCLSQGQTVIDVGIHVQPDGSICGDVNRAAAEAVVAAFTPVPGGVGALTTALLVDHVIQSAQRHMEQREA